MRLIYRYSKEAIEMSETPNEADVEFEIKLLSHKHWNGILEVQKKFEDNEVYTDVLFYAYENHRYKVIVRQDYYVDFIMELLKHRLLEAAEWV